MGSLNFNNLFIGISVEQIIVLLVLVVVSILFGLMAGASIFYPLGYHRCRKDGKGGSAMPILNKESASSAAVAKQKVVPDTFDTDNSYEYSDNDLFNFVDEDEEESPEPTRQEVAEENSQPEEKQEAPHEEESIVDEMIVIPALMDIAPGTGEHVEVVGEPLRDDAFVRMEEHRKQQVPIINRSVLLHYCASMTPLAADLPIRVIKQSAENAFDRILVKDYTFAIVFEYDKVLRLVVRLHPNTIGALRRAAGNTVIAEDAYGPDWYGWVVTDIEHCEKVVAKVLDMSYKYVAHACYMRGKDNDFVPKADSYEDDVIAVADAYSPQNDTVYTALAGQMNSKYQLHYFGKKEAAKVAKAIQGDMTVTVDDVNSSTSILKADGTMFAVIYESYGVVKLLFRADKEYVDALHAQHLYVGCSEVPKSQYRQWYYAILDKSFDREQCEQILLTAYSHVSK